MLEYNTIFVYGILTPVLVLIFFWLFIYFEIFEEEKKEKKPKTYPRLAVIVPTLFEGRGLEKTVKSLLRMEYPSKRMKVYIGLNKATDETTRKTAYSLASSNVKVVDTGLNGKAAVMNYIIKNSLKNEEFILTLDADSMADRKLAARLLPYFKDPKVGVVTPSVAVYRPKKKVEMIQKYDYLFSIVLRKAFSHVGSLLVAPGPGSMFRRSVIEKIGYFDENNITEDMEIAIRMILKGYKVENSVRAFSYTVVPATAFALLKQRIRWYSGFFFNMFKYRSVIMDRKKNGLMDRGMLLLIFLSVSLTMVAIPIIAYYIYTFAVLSYQTLSNIGFAQLLQPIPVLIQESVFSVNEITIISLAALVFGLYSMFYSLKSVNRKINPLTDTAWIGAYVSLFAYFLAFTWLYGFFNASIMRRKMKWKAGE